MCFKNVEELLVESKHSSSSSSSYDPSALAPEAPQPLRLIVPTLNF
jgi:hypothetical protein